MAIQKIIKTKNNNTEVPEILRTKCDEVTEFDQNLAQLAQDLIDTSNDPNENPMAGLAAPQININKRVCLVKKFRQDPEDETKETVENIILVNPKILSKSKPTKLNWEGCLSIPDLYAKVVRPKRIKIEAQDINGKTFKIKAEGFFARIILHEIDHLNGVLFTDICVGKQLTESQLDALYAEKNAK